MKAQLASFAGPYYRTIGTDSSVELSIKKMDKPRATGYKKNPYWKRAKKFCGEYFLKAFRRNTRMLGGEEILKDMRLTAVAGQPWQACGLKTKADCFRNEYFMEYLFKPVKEWGPIVWKVAPKTEYYHQDDLDANKVRTFIIPPTHFFYYQKALYHTQNEALKEFWWSAYGFNPYQGGTNRMARRFLKWGNLFVYYDVKGWDRQLPIMRTVYSMRNKFIDSRYIELAWFIAENTIQSLLLLPNGKIIHKIIGNNSGSGCTTADNIIAHCFIVCLTLLVLYDGDEALVERTVVELYGDDNASALPYTPKPKSEIELVFREVYRLFGLELDPFVILDTLEGVEFLGFKFKKVAAGWIPCYNQGRLVAGFCYNIEKREDIQVSITKAWMLTVMAAGGDRDCFDTMSQALTIYLNENEDSGNPVIQSFCDMGVPTYEECEAFFLGLEGARDFGPVFHGWLAEEFIPK